MQSQRVGMDNNVDGGVRDILPLKALVEDPLNVDEIHVICLSPVATPPTDITYKNILQVAGRSVDLLTNDALQNDYGYADLINKLVDYRSSLSFSVELQDWLADKRKVRLFKYVPTESVCETTDFRTEMIQKGIEHGRKIASEVLKDYRPAPAKAAIP